MLPKFVYTLLLTWKFKREPEPNNEPKHYLLYHSINGIISYPSIYGWAINLILCTTTTMYTVLSHMDFCVKIIKYKLANVELH